MMYVPDARTAAFISATKLPYGDKTNLFETVADAISESCRRGWRCASVDVGSDYLDVLARIRHELEELGYLATLTTGGKYATASEMIADEHRYDLVHLDVSW